MMALEMMEDHMSSSDVPDTAIAGTVDNLAYEVWGSPDSLAESAAADIADELRSRLARQDAVRVVFAAAPSQAQTLAILRNTPGIDWSRVHAFHMDEYVELPASAPQRFGNWLKRNFFDSVDLGEVNLIAGASPEDPDSEAVRYGRLLTRQPVDIVLAGVGVNGHLAFNDPPANFAETAPVRVVELSEASRMQQVSEALFDSIDDVPRHAWTVSIPVLMSGQRIFCMVPGAFKNAAIRRMLTGPVSGECPASILRSHPHATLYLDAESGAGIR
jgi:glucosamine-6-phosphate deaminase